MDEAKCPVMHGALTKNQGTGTSNKEWWPNQLNLSILHQHDMKALHLQFFLSMMCDQVLFQILFQQP